MKYVYQTTLGSKLGEESLSLGGGVGLIVGIVGFQPLMVVSPTASYIRWCMQVYAGDIMKLYEGKYTFTQVHGLLPKPLLRTSTHSFEIHPHSTRYPRDLHKFPSHTTLFAKSFLVSATDNWSLLPESIKTSPTLRSFDRCHKLHLLDIYNT